jgi:hypothetical protein
MPGDRSYWFKARDAIDRHAALAQRQASEGSRDDGFFNAGRASGLREALAIIGAHQPKTTNEPNPEEELVDDRGPKA